MNGSDSDEGRSHPRPFAVRLLMACLAFLSIGAIGGGSAFAIDPSGRTMGLPVRLLSGSPFADYLLPGLILLSVLGVYPLVVLYGLYTRRGWAWTAALTVGLALVVWIAVQGSIVGFGHWFQWLYLGLGAAILLLVALPSVRRAYDIGRPRSTAD